MWASCPHGLVFQRGWKVKGWVGIIKGCCFEAALPRRLLVEATLVPENVLGWVDDIKGREVGEAGLGWRLEEGSP